MTSRLTPLGEIIGTGLQDLERRATAALRLTDRVRKALRGPEKEHVLSASSRAETLHVYMDSAAWCAQVRYDQIHLLQTLQAQGETQFTKLKVGVGRDERIAK